MIVHGDSLSSGDEVSATLTAVAGGSPSTFSRTYTTVAKPDGTWELSLEPNDRETSAPRGSLYTIIEDVGGADTTTVVTVPRGFGRVHLDDLPGGPPAVGQVDATWGANDVTAVNAVIDRLVELGIITAL